MTWSPPCRSCRHLLRCLTIFRRRLIRASAGGWCIRRPRYCFSCFARPSPPWKTSSKSCCRVGSGSISCGGSCPTTRGLPARDTLNDVINGLDAELFRTCLREPGRDAARARAGGRDRGGPIVAASLRLQTKIFGRSALTRFGRPSGFRSRRRASRASWNWRHDRAERRDWRLRQPGRVPPGGVARAVAKPLAKRASTAPERASGFAGGHRWIAGRVGLRTPKRRGAGWCGSVGQRQTRPRPIDRDKTFGVRQSYIGGPKVCSAKTNVGRV